MRYIKGGVLLISATKVKNPGSYRMHLLCHVAFGGSHGDADQCPLHHRGVRVHLKVSASGTELKLQHDAPKRASDIRSLVSRLYP